MTRIHRSIRRRRTRRRLARPCDRPAPPSARPGRPSPSRLPKKEAPKDTTGADALTLRDGKTLLGQIYDPSPRGTYLVLVRRAWAEANLPDWAEKWKSGEKEAVEAADRQRRERLALWRRDRLVAPGPAPAGDRITRLARPGAGQARRAGRSRRP